jgi:hypothetical protein
MQEGSLLQCVQKSHGIYNVCGEWVRLLPDIDVGAVVTCGGIVNGNYLGKSMPGLILLEDGHAKHPQSDVILLRQVFEFKEIQPPMEIDIESIIEQPLEHA